MYTDGSDWRIEGFLGEYNKVSARDIPGNALAFSDNVCLSDSGALLRRPGRSLAKPAEITASHQAKDGSVYVVYGGSLCRVNDDLSFTVLGASTATAFCDSQGYLWCNDGASVFGNRMTSYKVPVPPAPDVVTSEGTDWYVACAAYLSRDGLHSAASATVSFKSGANPSVIPPSLDGYIPVVYLSKPNGEDMYSQDGLMLSPDYTRATGTLPENAALVEMFDSRIFAVTYYGGHSVVNFSFKNIWHLFDESNDYFVIPGRVEAIASTSAALFIGTGETMFAYDGQNLVQVADYGVVPGKPVDKDPDSDTLFVHSERGICTAFPFQNVTQAKCSLPTGSKCATRIVYHRGIKQFLVMRDGAISAHNPF